MIIDAYNYMTNKAFVGYKLANLQYRNEVDADNRYKKKPIYAIDIDTGGRPERMLAKGLISYGRFLEMKRTQTW